MPTTVRLPSGRIISKIDKNSTGLLNKNKTCEECRLTGTSKQISKYTISKANHLLCDNCFGKLDNLSECIAGTMLREKEEEFGENSPFPTTCSSNDQVLKNGKPLLPAIYVKYNDINICKTHKEFGMNLLEKLQNYF